MGVFWSGTDDKCCDTLGSGDFTVSIVTNRKKKLLGRVDIYKPFRITLSGVDIAVEDEVNFAIPKAIQDEVDKKVETKSCLSNFGNTKHWRGNSYLGYEDPYEWEDKDGFRKRWYMGDTEVWDVVSKRWILESVFDKLILSGILKAKNLLGHKKEEKEEEIPLPKAIWNSLDDCVVFEDGETFKPSEDERKFGSVPRPDMFEVCAGATINACASCVYLKECDDYLVKNTV